MAHGEGNYFADGETLRRLEGDGRIAFRYCDAGGTVTADANRNGSLHAIAGVYSQHLNVLGLMPHPENLIDPLVGGADGRGLFESLMNRAAQVPASSPASPQRLGELASQRRRFATPFLRGRSGRPRSRLNG